MTNQVYCHCEKAKGRRGNLLLRGNPRRRLRSTFGVSQQGGIHSRFISPRGRVDERVGTGSHCEEAPKRGRRGNLLIRQKPVCHCEYSEESIRPWNKKDHNTLHGAIHSGIMSTGDPVGRPYIGFIVKNNNPTKVGFESISPGIAQHSE